MKKTVAVILCSLLFSLLVAAPKKVKPLEYAPVLAVSSSSELTDPQFAGKYIYPAAYVLDGNFKTTWAEAVKGPGIGEYLTIQFSKPLVFDQIQIVNGLGFNSTLYYANNRVKLLEIFATYDKLYQKRTVLLKDHMQGWQRVRYKLPQAATSVTFTIRSVYRGNSYNDTCISDIRFLYKGKILPYHGADILIHIQEIMAKAATRRSLNRNYVKIFDKYYMHYHMRRHISLANDTLGIQYTFRHQNAHGKGAYEMHIKDSGFFERGTYQLHGNRIIFIPDSLYARVRRVMYFRPAGDSGLYLNGIFYKRSIEIVDADR